jgi:hypothetical protein
MSNSQRVRELAVSLVHDANDAAALIELVLTITDPTGDQTRYGMGMKAIAVAYPETAEGQQEIAKLIEKMGSPGTPVIG